MRFVVLAAVLMMVVSIIGPAGSVLLHDGSGKTLDLGVLLQETHPEETGEEETDAHAVFLALGMEALHETFAPEFLPLSGGRKIFPMSMLLPHSNFLPRIYRPPIS